MAVWAAGEYGLVADFRGLKKSQARPNLGAKKQQFSTHVYPASTSHIVNSAMSSNMEQSFPMQDKPETLRSITFDQERRDYLGQKV